MPIQRVEVDLAQYDEPINWDPYAAEPKYHTADRSAYFCDAKCGLGYYEKKERRHDLEINPQATPSTPTKEG